MSLVHLKSNSILVVICRRVFGICRWECIFPSPRFASHLVLSCVAHSRVRGNVHIHCRRRSSSHSCWCSLVLMLCEATRPAKHPPSQSVCSVNPTSTVRTVGIRDAKALGWLFSGSRMLLFFCCKILLLLKDCNSAVPIVINERESKKGKINKSFFSDTTLVEWQRK